MSLNMQSGAEAPALQTLARWSELRDCGARSVWSAVVYRRFRLMATMRVQSWGSELSMNLPLPHGRGSVVNGRGTEPRA